MQVNLPKLQLLAEATETLVRVHIRPADKGTHEAKPIDGDFVGSVKRKLEQFGKIASSALSRNADSLNVSLNLKDKIADERITDTLLPFLAKHKYTMQISR